MRDLGVPVDKVEFTFRKPDSFEVVGSYSIKCVAKPYVNVDVLIRMPKVIYLSLALSLSLFPLNNVVIELFLNKLKLLY